MEGAWNNNGVLRKLLPVAILLLAQGVCLNADDATPGPRLLLSAQRLRRLKRDRERKTSRWVAFENRVMTVPDSPERGFELALYYAITGDEAKGREAVGWAVGHMRLSALVLDWCAPVVSAEQKKRLSEVGATMGIGRQRVFAGERDAWFHQLAFGDSVPAAPDLSAKMGDLVRGAYRDSDDFYALCELIYAVRANTRVDLRQADAHFFSVLPELLLLSARPGELNKPDWRMHVAALALVAIDPNLPSSQFLQSWALEDSQTLREGPGVAYELLWADPYLPGVGYQNMEPSVYDERTGLFARAGWEPNSCWIAISAGEVEQENCPANWQAETVTFGHLTLIPMTDRCIEIPHAANRNDSVIVWKLKPGETITHGKGKEARTWEADGAGLWRPGANIEGKACIAGH
jgi:hypothetical protein